ncbi:RNA methyltransferase [soil metagenome]
MQKLRNDELERPSLQDYLTGDKLPLIIVLDNVRSALNTGSIFRTADAFRIKEIHLCGITACPPNKEVLKTALGATSSVKWIHFEDTLESIKNLRTGGYKVYAIEQVRGSIPLNAFKASSGPVALILGHEMDGVSQEVIDACDGCIEIPQEGIKHSLNVSVCGGIICWEVYRQYLEQQVK